MNLNTRFTVIEKLPGYFIAFFLTVFAGIAIATYLSESPRRREALALRSGIQARAIAFGMNQFATQHADANGRAQYPVAGSNWESLLVDGGFVEKQEFISPFAKTGLSSYFYIPPPAGAFNPEKTPLIVENPLLHNNQRATVVFADEGASQFADDELWKVLSGLRASDGTVFNRPGH